jgi:hypothetical protein
MKITTLSSKNYENNDSINYGDCTIIDDETGNILVYDCGHEKHAKRVLKYAIDNNIINGNIILSHNDDDHYLGIKTLLANKVFNKVYTPLLLKYKTEILKELDDKRRNRNSVGESIKEKYDNIADLNDYSDRLVDIYQENSNDFVVLPLSGVKIVGPNKQFMISTAAKYINEAESDQVAGESCTNATCVQVSIENGINRFLLTGDSCFESLEENIKEHNFIQIPHHGKQAQAEKIFQVKDKYGEFDTVYFVSDNTGNSNGGSDNLNTQGHVVKNTKTDGDLDNIGTISYIPKCINTLGANEL